MCGIASRCRQPAERRFSLDLSECVSLNDDAFLNLLPACFGPALDDAESTAVKLIHLCLSGCSSLTSTSLAALASSLAICDAQELRLNHMQALSQRPVLAAPPSPLLAMVQVSGQRLQTLHIDGAFLSDSILSRVADHCSGLLDLSMVGCAGVSDAGLKLVAQGCIKLQKLAVGGAKGGWTERLGLASFNNLESLVLSRRHFCRDEDLVAVLKQHPGLKHLRLAGCGSITDAALCKLPLNLQQAIFILCDSITGKGLERLQSLQELRLRSCVKVSMHALQVCGVCSMQAGLVLVR